MRLNRMRLGLLLVCVAIIGGFAPHALANYDLCSAPVGVWSTCYNWMTFNDSMAYAGNQMNDNYVAHDPYHITFNSTIWEPQVWRGSPQYQTYYITDNFNGGAMIYQNNDYNGKYLNDYYQIYIYIGVTAGYYPRPYGSPTTTMYIRNASPLSCVPPIGLLCTHYPQLSQFSVS